MLTLSFLFLFVREVSWKLHVWKQLQGIADNNPRYLPIYLQQLQDDLTADNAIP